MDTKTLRQKILNLAIRGKLVPQNPDDEPASVLLEKIRLEKQNMVKEGKLKPKDVKNDTIIFRGDDNLHYEKFQNGTVKCIEDEIPFEVPEGWEWCRLKNICMMSAGKFKSSDLIKDEPFDSSYPCFGGNGIRGYVDEFNQDGTFSIVGRQGALCGNINIATGKFYATEHAVVTYLYSGIDFSWNNYILEALNLNSYASGAAQPGLSVANVLNILVPLPSHDEQSRIGNKISTASSLIEKIDNQKKELLNIINLANIKTLELAIHGKLVPQNSGDESASVLLERIRSEKENLIKAGKIKRDKKESVIYRGDDNSYYEKCENGSKRCISEEIPFDLPSSWEWCRLSDIVDLYSGQDLTPDKYTDNMTGIPYITGASNLDNGKVIVNRWTDTPTTRAIPGDLLLTCKGSGVGKMAFNNIEECHIARQIMALRSKNMLNKDYMKIVLDAFIKDITEQANGIIPGVRREVILSLFFPLPPSEEQKRIVSTIEKIFENFETVKISLI